MLREAGAGLTPLTSSVADLRPVVFRKLQTDPPSPYNSGLPSNHCLSFHVTLPASRSSSDTEQPIKKLELSELSSPLKTPGECVVGGGKYVGFHDFKLYLGDDSENSFT